MGISNDQCQESCGGKSKAVTLAVGSFCECAYCLDLFTVSPTLGPLEKCFISKRNVKQTPTFSTRAKTSTDQRKPTVFPCPFPAQESKGWAEVQQAPWDWGWRQPWAPSPSPGLLCCVGPVQRWVKVFWCLSNCLQSEVKTQKLLDEPQQQDVCVHSPVQFYVEISTHPNSHLHQGPSFLPPLLLLLSSYWVGSAHPHNKTTHWEVVKCAYRNLVFWNVLECEWRMGVTRV